MTKLWTMNVLYACLAFSIVVLSRLLNVYFVSIGLDAATIGMLAAIRPAAAFFGELTWASLVDRGASVRAVVLSITSVGVIAFACIPIARGIPAIAVLYAISSFCLNWTGLRDACCMATLKNQGYEPNVFGSVRKYLALGFGLGGLCGGTLADHFGEIAIIVVFVAGQFVVFIITAVSPLDAPSKHDEAGAGAPSSAQNIFVTLRSGWVLIFFLNLFAYGFAASAVETYLFVYLLKDFPAASSTLVGMTLVVMTLFELPVFQYGARLIEKFGFTILFAFCHSVFALRCVMYFFLPAAHPWLVLLIEPLHGITFALMWITAVDFGRKYAPPAYQARFQALSTGIYFQLSNVFGTLTWGVAIRTEGFRYSYMLDAALIMIWSLIYIIIARQVAPSNTQLSQDMLGDASRGSVAEES